MAKSTNSSTNTGGKDVSQDLAGDSFLSSLQSKLMQQAEAISSSNTGIEKSINAAIKGVQTAQGASEARINSAFEREKGYRYDTGNVKVTDANEARRGFATNTGILKQIYADTDKEVKDLEQRKQELILQGESDAAGKIAELQLKSLEFRQKSTQDAFNNLLSLSNFGLSVRDTQRQEKAQNLAERQAINNIALEYGLPVNENDTIDSITTKAAPFASEKQKLELSKMRAEINRANAEAAKALRGDPSEAPFDPITSSILAKAARSGDTSFLAGLKTNEQYASVYNDMQKQEAEESKTLYDLSKNYKTASEFIKAMKNSDQTYDQTLVERVAAAAYTKGSNPTMDYFKTLWSESKKAGIGPGINTWGNTPDSTKKVTDLINRLTKK